ncbi:MAG: OmpA family protein [Pseudomonadota bacterium]
MPKRYYSAGLIALSALLAGCGASVDSQQTRNAQCVDIPNGMYFQVVEGRLVSTKLSDIQGEERPSDTARRIGRTLAGMGFPWVSIDWDGEVATVYGLARDENSRSDAFIAAKSVFEADNVAGKLVQRVVNRMDVRDAADAIAMRLTEELEDEGLGWLSVSMAGRVATLTGTARNPEAKEDAYRAGRSTVEGDRDAGEIVNIVVDGIALPGDVSTLGDALLGLTPDASSTECQAAFNQVMAERRVSFVSGESIVDNESARLLDALTGVALLCEAYEIEIAGYTDVSETIGDSLDLSQRRASAVRDYLMAYGVDPDRLAARGYGRADLVQAKETSENASEALAETSFVVRERFD